MKKTIIAAVMFALAGCAAQEPVNTPKVASATSVPLHVQQMLNESRPYIKDNDPAKRAKAAADAEKHFMEIYNEGAKFREAGKTEAEAATTAEALRLRLLKEMKPKKGSEKETAAVFKIVTDHAKDIFLDGYYTR